MAAHRRCSLRCPSRRRWRAEDGSGTVLVLTLVMLLFAAGGTVALVGAATAARHRAETAADLAALSAASAAANGEAAPCAVGRRVARANGAVLVRCVIDGPRVQIAVTLQPRGPLAGMPPARAQARAGPVR